MPPSSQVVKLYIKHLHQIDHGGVESTLAKLQGKFWVPSGPRFIKTVKARCVFCRKLDTVTANQRMGQVSSERLKPTPPFYYIVLDLFGAFDILKELHVKLMVSFINVCPLVQFIWT